MALTRLGSESEFKHSPSVAVNAAGRVHVVYRGADQQIHYRRWRRKGWDPEETVPSPAARNYHAHVVTAPDGPPHVVFTAELGKGSATYAIMYTTRQENQWSEPVRLSTEPGAQVPRVAIGPDGTLHVVYSSFATNQFYYTRNSGGGWSAPIAVAEGLVPEIAVGPDGRVHAVWMLPKKPYGIFYGQVDKHGAFASRRIAKAHEQQLPTLAPDSQGRVHIAWYRGDRGTNRLAYTRLEADGSNVIVGDAQGPLTFATFSRIAVDCADRAHLVFQGKQSASGRWRVYQRVFDGDAVGAPQRLDAPELAEQCQAPDVSANGKVITFVWCETDTGACYADVLAVECGAQLGRKRRPARKKTPPKTKRRATSKRRSATARQSSSAKRTTAKRSTKSVRTRTPAKRSAKITRPRAPARAARSRAGKR